MVKRATPIPEAILKDLATSIGIERVSSDAKKHSSVYDVLNDIASDLISDISERAIKLTENAKRTKLSGADMKLAIDQFCDSIKNATADFSPLKAIPGRPDKARKFPFAPIHTAIKKKISGTYIISKEAVWGLGNYVMNAMQVILQNAKKIMEHAKRKVLYGEDVKFAYQSLTA